MTCSQWQSTSSVHHLTPRHLLEAAYRYGHRRDRIHCQVPRVRNRALVRLVEERRCMSLSVGRAIKLCSAYQAYLKPFQGYTKLAQITMIRSVARYGPHSTVIQHQDQEYCVNSGISVRLRRSPWRAVMF